LFFFALSIFLLGCSKQDSHPHVIVIVVDTVRADIVEEVHTPNLDRLARSGQKIEKAWAPSTWTAASVISLFSGKAVVEHGWDYRMPKDLNKGESYPSFDVEFTIAEVLKSKGYKTTGLYANQLLHRNLGFDRGFDTWKYVSDIQMALTLKQELKKGGSRSNFVYLHLYGAHQPLRPSSESMEKWGIKKSDVSSRGGIGLGAFRTKGGGDVYRRSYRAVVEDIDRNLGMIFDVLAELEGERIVVVTSDHGELLGEHGLVGHDAYVYEPLTWVPLVVSGMKSLEEPFSLVSLPFEICRSLSLDCPFTRTHDFVHVQREGEVAIVTKNWEKWLYGGCVQLHLDPKEENIGSCSPSIEKYFDLLNIFQANQPRSILQKQPFSPERLQQLRSLGYVED
jgi:hypothetical protein